MSNDTLIPTWQLHHRLALALEASGVSSERMAAELGVHVNTVHNYAAGRRTPKLGLVKQWADVCRIDRDWLWSGASVPTTSTRGYPDQLDLFAEEDQATAPGQWRPSLAAA